jgi:hypothetical protein
MQEHHDHDEPLDRIAHKLDSLIRKVEKMAIDQATFDADLAGLVQAVTDEGTAVTALTTAVDAFIAAHPGIDFSAEDANVQGAVAQAASASQALAAELAKITPAPAP